MNLIPSKKIQKYREKLNLANKLVEIAVAELNAHVEMEIETEMHERIQIDLQAEHDRLLRKFHEFLIHATEREETVSSLLAWAQEHPQEFAMQQRRRLQFKQSAWPKHPQPYLGYQYPIKQQINLLMSPLARAEFAIARKIRGFQQIPAPTAGVAMARYKELEMERQRQLMQNPLVELKHSIAVGKTHELLQCVEELRAQLSCPPHEIYQQLEHRYDTLRRKVSRNILRERAMAEGILPSNTPMATEYSVTSSSVSLLSSLPTILAEGTQRLQPQRSFDQESAFGFVYEEVASLESMHSPPLENDSFSPNLEENDLESLVDSNLNLNPGYPVDKTLALPSRSPILKASE